MVPSGAADDQAQPLRFFRALNLAPHLNLPSVKLLRDARRRERVRERAACGHCERELERMLTDESIEPKPFPEQVEKQMRLPSCLGCCTLTCGSMSIRSLEGCDGQPTTPCLRPCPRLEQCSSCQLMICEDCQDYERCRTCNKVDLANEQPLRGLHCSDCSFTCAMCDSSFCFDCCPDAEKCDGCKERYCGHGDCAMDDEGLLDFWTKKGDKNFCHGCAQCIRWEIRREEEEGCGSPVEWPCVALCARSLKKQSRILKIAHGGCNGEGYTACFPCLLRFSFVGWANNRALGPLPTYPAYLGSPP